MPPVAAVTTGGQHAPSNFDKCMLDYHILKDRRLTYLSIVKMGAMMGGSMPRRAVNLSVDSLLTCHSRRSHNGIYLWYELVTLPAFG